METKYDKTDRHESNLEEKRFHDKFIEEMSFGGDIYKRMSRLAFPSIDGDRPVTYLRDGREAQIMVNTIQWLGSSVGQAFLRDLGYVKVKD